MASSNISTAAAIADLKRNMILCIQIWSFCLFTLGLIGHSLNIYVFTRPKYRGNSCARYFLASSASGYAVVCLIIPLRLLQICYQIDVFVSSVAMCSILSYLLGFIRVLPSWFIILASIDRYFCSSSSVALRRWSSTRIASRVIPLTVLFVALIYLHLPFHYTIIFPQRTCTFESSDYQAFFALFNMVIWSWIPTVCMLTFGALILRHIHLVRQRVVPQNTAQRKTDRQLIRMLFFQSFVLCSMTTTLAISSLYISITNGLRAKTDFEKAKDNYLNNVMNYVAITGPCISFYVFTLSSQVFRRELIKSFAHR